ncbi:MAG: squalene synthase HpnC [Nitrospirae bacterium]|nr:squalene synthase HpnC [Nitrospirota bacterium]
MDVENAFRYCEKITRDHSENFPVGSWWIPREKRKFVYSIYAFARTADDFADEAGVHDRIGKLLDWDEQLQSCYQGEARHPIFIALRETVRRYPIPLETLRNLLTAFRMDVTTCRYRKMSEVLNYCQFSANPVGRIVLYLFDYKDPRLHSWSDAICTALQLANFWQDVSIDLEKDRIYLPLEEMEQFHYSEEELKKRVYNPSFRALLTHEVEQTRRLLEQGRPLCDAVGKDLRMELRLVWLGGMRILERIEENDYDVFRRRPQITSWDKVRLVYRAGRAWRAGMSRWTPSH